MLNHTARGSGTIVVGVIAQLLERMRVVCAAWLAAVVLVAGSVSVPALAQQEMVVWQPGPQAAGDATYTGYVEQPPNLATTSGAPFVVSGWMVDTTAQGWSGIDQVQVYTGLMGSGGTLLASGSVGLPRPDVAAASGNPNWTNSGFSAQVPGSALQLGVTVLQLYGHTPDKGWWYSTLYLAVNSAPTVPEGGPPTVSISRPNPNETIPGGTTSYTITGSAADPKATASDSGIDQVAVYLNGARGNAHSVFLGNATLNGTNWSLTFAPNLYPWGYTDLYVYARSHITGLESFTTQFFNIQ
jgi:hypothetical protein